MLQLYEKSMEQLLYQSDNANNLLGYYLVKFPSFERQMQADIESDFFL